MEFKQPAGAGSWSHFLSGVKQAQGHSGPSPATLLPQTLDPHPSTMNPQPSTPSAVPSPACGTSDPKRAQPWCVAAR
eukprot:107658-Rhodomonas_salina.3